jgi:hypothetical protein
LAVARLGLLFGPSVNLVHVSHRFARRFVPAFLATLHIIIDILNLRLALPLSDPRTLVLVSDSLPSQ